MKKAIVTCDEDMGRPLAAREHRGAAGGRDLGACSVRRFPSAGSCRPEFLRARRSWYYSHGRPSLSASGAPKEGNALGDHDFGSGTV